MDGAGCHDAFIDDIGFGGTAALLAAGSEKEKSDGEECFSHETPFI
jgi:hypothetical protein